MSVKNSMYCYQCKHARTFTPLTLKSHVSVDGNYNCFRCEHCGNRQLSEIEEDVCMEMGRSCMQDYRYDVFRELGGIYFTEEVRRRLLREED